MAHLIQRHIKAAAEQPVTVVSGTPVTDHEDPEGLIFCIR
jgi:hypothetical protein